MLYFKPMVMLMVRCWRWERKDGAESGDLKKK